MRIAVKTKVMSIVHGQSEYCICNNIKSNLRIKHAIYARNKGKLPIQVNGIMSILHNSIFGSYKDFIREYSDIEHKKNQLINFRLFLIMDVDDCSLKIKNKYINKEMFIGHWLYEYITPIYNDPNLEMTMSKAKIEVHKKKDYILLFPTSHGDLDVIKAIELSQKLDSINCTNMEEYVEYCISLIPQI